MCVSNNYSDEIQVNHGDQVGKSNSKFRRNCLDTFPIKFHFDVDFFKKLEFMHDNYEFVLVDLLNETMCIDFETMEGLDNTVWRTFKANCTALYSMNGENLQKCRDNCKKRLWKRKNGKR